MPPLRPLLAPLATAATLAVVLAACSSSSDATGSSGTSGSSGSSGTSGGTTYSTELKQGIATYYDYSGSDAVSCSYGIESDTDITAIDDPEFAGANSCGACVDVSGPKGKVTVRIVDRCPGCEKGHLDLSEQAFAKIADKSDGRVPITYNIVACKVTGNMTYELKDGSSEYWTAILVKNHRLPIAKLEYKKNGTYTAMPRADYNYFIDEGGVGKQPNGIAIRITAADGQVVEDTVPAVEANKVFPGNVQFK